MKLLIRWVDAASGFAGALSGFMMCIGLALIFIEIILRSAFSSTLFITEEYAGYLMCGLTFCALAYTLREKGHIRMTFLYKIVTGRARIYLDFACFIVGLLFCLALTYFTFDFFWDSILTGSQSMQISETYLAVPQFFMPFGAAILTLQFLSETLKSIMVIKGDTEGLSIRQEAEDLGR
ncbi:MAG: TRAP transporter small permease subunit [Desulfobacterales bacterium]